MGRQNDRRSTARVPARRVGIGAIALLLAANGTAGAVHFGTDEDGAGSTVDEIERAGGRAFAVRAELGGEHDVETLFAGLEVGLAGRPLDILVNNAAAAPAGPIGITTRAEFDHLFAVNVRAPYFIIQRALPLLSDGGRIVTISSVATRMANPAQTSFAMTKGAVEIDEPDPGQRASGPGASGHAVAPGAPARRPNSLPSSPRSGRLIAAPRRSNRWVDRLCRRRSFAFRLRRCSLGVTGR